jgi:hypothetical protein
MKDCLSIWFSRKDGKWVADLTIKCDGKTYAATATEKVRGLALMMVAVKACTWYIGNGYDND